MNKINILRYAKLQAIVTGFAGIVAGLLYSVGGTFYDIFTIGLNKGTALAYFALPVMPIYFAALGLITGLIGAYLYNVSLKWHKGVNLKIKK